jgi:hypothetical protein
MGDHPNAEALRKGYAAFAARDMDPTRSSSVRSKTRSNSARASEPSSSSRENQLPGRHDLRRGCLSP